MDRGARITVTPPTGRRARLILRGGASVDVDALYDDVAYALGRARHDGGQLGLPVHDGVEFRRFDPGEVLTVRELPPAPCPWLEPA